ncbi:adp-ribosylation factor-related protein [Anaeramoeba ignava]|uniref:Adp-ribosylation factor-related protein n=1 Tax=Anaeramoeba ignava TaxID=1746090 RepID=A0A9Q0RHL0_ANAIG|nr:adp-ribosylation factor-related protein [Anaeramoeba ignava]
MFSLFRYAYRKCIDNPKRSVLILGLQNAGKTSLLNDIRLLAGQEASGPVVPTVGQNYCKFSKGGYEFTINDLGGQPNFRDSWKFYFNVADVVVYVIDSNDKQKFEESFREFKKLIHHKLLRFCPIFICANKQDEPNSLSADKIDSLLSFSKECGTKRTFAIIETIAAGEKKHKGASDIISLCIDKFKNDKFLAQRIELRESGLLEEDQISSDSEDNELKNLPLPNIEDLKDLENQDPLKVELDENQNENQNENQDEKEL